jgi:hypothetical protein
MRRRSFPPPFDRTMVPSSAAGNACTEMAAEPAQLHSRDDERLLIRAAELAERGWCRDALARDRDGRQVEPWTVGACRWSPLGALLRAWYEWGGEGIDPFVAAYISLALATGGRVAEWSAAPWRTQRHVVRAFAHAREFLPQAREQRRSLRAG